MKILKYIVTRPSDSVEVYLMQNKNDHTYSFVNITKGHICPCRFTTISAAIEDLDRLIEDKKIIRYEITQ